MLRIHVLSVVDRRKSKAHMLVGIECDPLCFARFVDLCFDRTRNYCDDIQWTLSRYGFVG